MTKKLTFILASLLILLIVAVVLFLLFSRSSNNSGQQTRSFFGFGGTVPVSLQTVGGGETNVPSTNSSSLNKVFKIADGPIASAAFTQTTLPTTTLVRYVMATNGHVMDLAIDVPGAAAKPVSNTTIPGVFSAVWGQNATSTVLRYNDGGLIKSVAIAFASSTVGGVAAPTRIQFLPNSIISIAVSPDGKNIAYVLKTSGGVDGYIADITGANQKKLFSFFLSQVVLSWPSPGTLLLQTKSAADVPGIAFSINVRTGTVVPLLYASGLFALANDTFSKVIYQTVGGTANTHETYLHTMSTGQDETLLFNPLVEKCIWSAFQQKLLFCAAPLADTDASYLGLWHQGLSIEPESILQYDIDARTTGLVTTLGTDNQAPVGGVDQIASSPDGKYILFITRGDHSLWGVRLDAK